jgi:hypothetical protein
MLWITYRLLAIPVLLILGLKALVSLMPGLPKKRRFGYDRVLNEFGPQLSKIRFDHADWEKTIVEIPRKAVELYAAWQAYEEISTEGFDSYFLSAVGSSSSEARDGYEAMGLPEVAETI